MSGRIPFDEMERLFDRMSHVDDRAWGREWRGTDVDVADYDDEFVVMADVPGFEREEIDVSVHDGTLTIRAVREHAIDAGTEESRFVHREQRAVSVVRRVNLPERSSRRTRRRRTRTASSRLRSPRRAVTRTTTGATSTSSTLDRSPVRRFSVR